MVIVIILFFGAYFLWNKPTVGLNKYDLLIAWGFKIAVSLFFSWIYIDYYQGTTLTSDQLEFMREGKVLYKVSQESFSDYFQFMVGLETTEMTDKYCSSMSHWYSGSIIFINDCQNVIRVNSIIQFFSNNNVFVHNLVISFLSLLGFRELYKTFSPKINCSKRWFFFFLIAFPSLAFWTGSIIKEPFLILGMCLILSAAFGNLDWKKSSWRWGLGIALMLAFKPYVLICLVFALVFYYITKWVKLKLGVTFAIFLTITVLGLTILPSIREKVVNYLTRKQFDFINVSRGGLHAQTDSCFFFFDESQYASLDFTPKTDSVILMKPIRAIKIPLGKPGPFEDIYLKPDGTKWSVYFLEGSSNSSIEVTFINSSFALLVYTIPEAFVNATFRPFFTDPGGSLKYFSALETMLFFAWFFWQFRNWNKITDEKKIIITTLLLFSVSLLVLIGLTTPILGAIVRYRIPAYLALFLVSILLYTNNSSEKQTKKQDT